MKDFNVWNEKKKKTEEISAVIGVHEREIWWISLGLNIGVETDGKHSEFKRPVLVIKRFNREMVWILPVTSQSKSAQFYEKFEIQGEISYVAVTQIRTVSTKRFLRKVGVTKKEDFERIVKKVIAYLGKNESPL